MTAASLQRRAERPAEPLWLEWLTLVGVFVFCTWLLGVRGVWALLLGADPTGLTLVILAVFGCTTLWCGQRSRELQRQRLLLCQPLQARHDERNWAAEYADALKADAGTAADLLLEHSHGPHGTAWWVNGIQLKLGLLGKVIGFSMLALTIGKMQSFDSGQSQDLLRNLTAGLGVALLTTMVGLVGNILLGLQLTRLDRFADALVADIQRAAITKDAD